MDNMQEWIDKIIKAYEGIPLKVWQYFKSSKLSDGGVRDANGFICLMTTVTRYGDQPARYNQECAEKEAQAMLITYAPKMAEIIIAQQKQLEHADKLQQSSNYIIQDYMKLITEKDSIIAELQKELKVTRETLEAEIKHANWLKK